MVHRLTGRELSPEAVANAIDLSHTKYCSVQASLDPAIAVTNRFEIVPAGAHARESD
jgi:putative redox protein